MIIRNWKARSPFSPDQLERDGSFSSITVRDCAPHSTTRFRCGWRGSTVRPAKIARKRRPRPVETEPLAGLRVSNAGLNSLHCRQLNSVSRSLASPSVGRRTRLTRQSGSERPVSPGRISRPRIAWACAPIRPRKRREYRDGRGNHDRRQAREVCQREHLYGELRAMSPGVCCFHNQPREKGRVSHDGPSFLAGYTRPILFRLFRDQIDETAGRFAIHVTSCITVKPSLAISPILLTPHRRNNPQANSPSVGPHPVSRSPSQRAQNPETRFHHRY